MSETTVLPDLETWRAGVREWLVAHMPRRDPAQRGGRDGGHEETPEHDREQRALQRKIFEAGYAGLTWPREYGGAGLTPAYARAFNEEAAGYAMPTVTGVGPHIVGPTLLQFATEEQKAAWIPAMLAADEVWVQLLSEPVAGSDLAGLRTRATRDGDEWVLNGAKIWSTGALFADYGICLARTDWDVPKHKGLTFFKLPLQHPGVTIRPIREINGGAEFCEEFIDDVRIPDANRIGPVNGGWPIANALLAFERGAGGEGAPRAVPGAVGPRRLAPDLVAIAAGSGLLDDGAARQQIARAQVNDWAHAQLGARVGAMLRLGKADPNSASLIKLGQGIHNPIRAMIGMQLAGGQGIAWKADDLDGARPSNTYVNGRIMAIAGGSNQIQRNIIGERVLGLPREPSFDSTKPFNEVLKDAESWTGAS